MSLLSLTYLIGSIGLLSTLFLAYLYRDQFLGKRTYGSNTIQRELEKCIARVDHDLADVKSLLSLNQRISGTVTTQPLDFLMQAQVTISGLKGEVKKLRKYKKAVNE